MGRIWLILAAGALAVSTALAQTSATSQTNASAKNKTAASAGKPGAQVQSDTSLSASQETKASQEQSGKKRAEAQGSGSSSTSTSARAGQQSVNLASGTTIEAHLTGSLDSRRNKPGDQVVARTTKDVKSEGGVVLRKGTRLIGHVTEAKARAEGESESRLGILFDKAVMKSGQEVPINVVVQAIAAAQAAGASSLEEGEAMTPASGAGSMASSGRASTSGGSVVGAAGSTVGGAAGAVTSTAGQAVGATTGAAASATGAVGQTNVVGSLTSSSTGVIGLKDLTLNSQAASSTQGSLFTSSGKSVHLSSGTRLLLRAQGQAQ